MNSTPSVFLLLFEQKSLCWQQNAARWKHAKQKVPSKMQIPNVSLWILNCRIVNSFRNTSDCHQRKTTPWIWNVWWVMRFEFSKLIFSFIVIRNFTEFYCVILIQHFVKFFVETNVHWKRCKRFPKLERLFPGWIDFSSLREKLFPVFPESENPNVSVAGQRQTEKNHKQHWSIIKMFPFVVASFYFLKS